MNPAARRSHFLSGWFYCFGAGIGAGIPPDSIVGPCNSGIGWPMVGPPPPPCIGPLKTMGTSPGARQVGQPAGDAKIVRLDSYGLSIFGLGFVEALLECRERRFRRIDALFDLLEIAFAGPSVTATAERRAPSHPVETPIQALSYRTQNK